MIISTYIFLNESYNYKSEIWVFAFTAQALKGLTGFVFVFVFVFLLNPKIEGVNFTGPNLKTRSRAKEGLAARSEQVC